MGILVYMLAIVTMSTEAQTLMVLSQRQPVECNYAVS